MSADITRQARGTGIISHILTVLTTFHLILACSPLVVVTFNIYPPALSLSQLSCMIPMHDPWKYAVCASFILSALESTRIDNPTSIEIAKILLISSVSSFQKLEIPVWTEKYVNVCLRLETCMGFACAQTKKLDCNMSGSLIADLCSSVMYMLGGGTVRLFSLLQPHPAESNQTCKYSPVSIYEL